MTLGSPWCTVILRNWRTNLLLSSAKVGSFQDSAVRASAGNVFTLRVLSWQTVVLEAPFVAEAFYSIYQMFIFLWTFFTSSCRILLREKLRSSSSIRLVQAILSEVRLQELGGTYVLILFSPFQSACLWTDFLSEVGFCICCLSVYPP